MLFKGEYIKFRWCSITDAWLWFQTNRNRHNKMHKIRSEKQFPYKCGMVPCQSSFNSMEKLKLHLRTHNNDYDECQFCSYRYFDPYNYKTHLRYLVSIRYRLYLLIMGSAYDMPHIIDGFIIFYTINTLYGIAYICLAMKCSSKPNQAITFE